MLRIQLDSQTYPRLFDATLFFMKRNAQLCNPEYTKKTRNLRAWPWKCAKRNGTSDRRTHTRTQTHMPFSTFQYTYYKTWLSWTLTQGNVTEKVNSELILVTAHCPEFFSDFEDITFDLLQHMMNGHVLQLHHTFVCINDLVSGLGVIQDILYGIICIGNQFSKYDYVFLLESKTHS
jgi:hypothetical protein